MRQLSQKMKEISFRLPDFVEEDTIQENEPLSAQFAAEKFIKCPKRLKLLLKLRLAPLYIEADQRIL